MYSPTQCKIVIGVMIGSMWIATILRVYVRQFMMKAMQIDDWLSCIALISFTASLGLYTRALDYGWGNNMGPDTDLSQTSRAMQCFIISELIVIPTNALIKVSFAFTLLRIVRSKLHIRTLYFCIFITVAMAIALEFLNAFACIPFSYWWKQFVDPTHGKEGRCMSIDVQKNSSYANGAVVLVVDLILGIIIPVHLLSALKMRMRTKLTAGILLSIGSLASIGTIIRFVYTPDIVTTNLTFTLHRAYFWILIESGAAIVCACASTWKPLLVRFKVLDNSSVGNYSHQTPNPKSWPLNSATEDTKLRALTRRKQDPTDDSSSLEALSHEPGKNLGIICTRHFEAVSERKSSSGPIAPKEQWDPNANSHASWLAV